jgi:hypothetical protein
MLRKKNNYEEEDNWWDQTVKQGTQDDWGETTTTNSSILDVAVVSNRADLIKFWVDSKQLKKSQLSPYLYLTGNSIDVLKFLFPSSQNKKNHDINIDICNESTNKRSLLTYFLENGHAEAAYILLKNDASIYAGDPNEDETLIAHHNFNAAIKLGNIAILDELLKTDPSLIDENQNHPTRRHLDWAIKNDQTQVLPRLLEAIKQYKNDAHDFEYFKELYTHALSAAVNKDDVFSTKLIIEASEDVYFPTRDRLDLVLMYEKDAAGQSLMTDMVERNALRIIHYLVKQKNMDININIDAECRWYSGQNALCLATSYQTAATLIDLGIKTNIEIKDKYAATTYSLINFLIHTKKLAVIKAIYDKQSTLFNNLPEIKKDNHPINFLIRQNFESQDDNIKIFDYYFSKLELTALDKIHLLGLATEHARISISKAIVDSLCQTHEKEFAKCAHVYLLKMLKVKIKFKQTDSSSIVQNIIEKIMGSYPDVINTSIQEKNFLEYCLYDEKYDNSEVKNESIFWLLGQKNLKLTNLCSPEDVKSKLTSLIKKRILQEAKNGKEIKFNFLYVLLEFEIPPIDDILEILSMLHEKAKQKFFDQYDDSLAATPTKRFFIVHREIMQLLSKLITQHKTKQHDKIIVELCQRLLEDEKKYIECLEQQLNKKRNPVPLNRWIDRLPTLKVAEKGLNDSFLIKAIRFIIKNKHSLEKDDRETIRFIITNVKKKINDDILSLRKKQSKFLQESMFENAVLQRNYIYLSKTKNHFSKIHINLYSPGVNIREPSSTLDPSISNNETQNNSRVFVSNQSNSFHLSFLFSTSIITQFLASLAFANMFFMITFASKMLLENKSIFLGIHLNVFIFFPLAMSMMISTVQKCIQLWKDQQISTRKKVLMKTVIFTPAAFFFMTAIAFSFDLKFKSLADLAHAHSIHPAVFLLAALVVMFLINGAGCIYNFKKLSKENHHDNLPYTLIGIHNTIQMFCIALTASAVAAKIYFKDTIPNWATATLAILVGIVYIINIGWYQLNKTKLTAAVSSDINHQSDELIPDDAIDLGGRHTTYQDLLFI